MLATIANDTSTLVGDNSSAHAVTGSRNTAIAIGDQLDARTPGNDETDVCFGAGRR